MRQIWNNLRNHSLIFKQPFKHLFRELMIRIINQMKSWLRLKTNFKILTKKKRQKRFIVTSWNKFWVKRTRLYSNSRGTSSWDLKVLAPKSMKIGSNSNTSKTFLWCGWTKVIKVELREGTSNRTLKNIIKNDQPFCS